MTMRVCLEDGCAALTRTTRCRACQSEYEKRRGSSTARGYGTEHRAARAEVVPLVATGLVRCWRCGDPIAADAPFDLGHDDDDRSRYRGPEHASCNRATAGRR